MSTSDDQSLTPRLLDQVLLTATLAFAQEFHLDHHRRSLRTQQSELGAALDARTAILAELEELETRTARLARSLTAAVASQEANALIRAYAVLDVRRIYTAMARIHRHLLTLYPNVSEDLIESVRTFTGHLAEAAETGYADASVSALTLLVDTENAGRAIRREIG